VRQRRESQHRTSSNSDLILRHQTGFCKSRRPSASDTLVKHIQQADCLTVSNPEDQDFPQATTQTSSTLEVFKQRSQLMTPLGPWFGQALSLAIPLLSPTAIPSVWTCLLLGDDYLMMFSCVISVRQGLQSLLLGHSLCCAGLCRTGNLTSLLRRTHNSIQEV